jgi:hypothetical protein
VTGFAWSAPKRYDHSSIEARREIFLPHHPWHPKCYNLLESQPFLVTLEGQCHSFDGIQGGGMSSGDPRKPER